MDDVLWCVVDLTLHLNGLFLLMAHFHTKNPEVTAPQVQSDEVTFLYEDKKVTKVLVCSFTHQYADRPSCGRGLFSDNPF